jgi:hypothetical protein
MRMLEGKSRHKSGVQMGYCEHLERIGTSIQIREVRGITPLCGGLAGSGLSASSPNDTVILEPPSLWGNRAGGHVRA